MMSLDIHESVDENHQDKMDERLLAEIPKFPHLYDVKHNDYKDIIKKANSWKTIAEAIGCENGDVAAKKWKNLRDYYKKVRRDANKGLPSGSGATAKSKWKYFDIIDSFMAPFVTTRQTTSNIRIEDADINLDDSFVDEASQSSQDEEDDITDDGRSDASPSLPPDEVTSNVSLPQAGTSSSNTQKGATQSRPPPRKRKQVDPLEQSICEYIQHVQSSKERALREEESEDDHYAKSVALRLKDMPKIIKARAKLKIEQVLFDAEASIEEQNHAQFNQGSMSFPPSRPTHSAATSSEVYGQSSSVLLGNINM